MAERGLDVLEKYDFEIKATSKGRGVIIAETDKGLKILKRYIGSGRHLKWCAQVLERLCESGIIYTDMYEKNKEGEYITESEDGGKYIVKRWYNCRDCDVSQYSDIMNTVRSVAFMHKELSNENLEKIYLDPAINDEYIRREKEMMHIRKYLLSKRDKNYFEELAIKTYDVFMPDFSEAAELCRNLDFGEPNLYHGSFNHHNVSFSDRIPVISNFEKMSYGCRLRDLYSFTRKILEKNNWNRELGMTMLDEYNRIMPLDTKRIKALFIFPERFWKIMNVYFNTSKSFIPTKNIEKLRNLIEQNKNRREFIEGIH